MSLKNLLVIALISSFFTACSFKSSLEKKQESELEQANKCQALKEKKESCYLSLKDNSYALLRLGNKSLQEKNYKEALVYLNKSKKDKNYNASLLLAYMYSKGYGVKKDNTKTMSLLKEAIVANPNASYQLARFYIQGDGVKKDLDKGIKYLEDAANRNLVTAKRMLAFVYSAGTFGIKKDEEKARYWANKYNKEEKRYFLKDLSY